jgi:DNA processing protein
MEQVVSEEGRRHLRWALTEGVGPVLFGRLLACFGDAQSALGASAAQLQSVERVGRELAERIARGRDAAPVEEEIAAARKHGVRILCRADEEFPPALRRIPDPPVVLYVRGELRPTDAIALAVVGSRRCSIYGAEQARRFGELLAGAGFTVISGLARGIDAFAQHGAVDAGGRSIAVLGSGLNEVYPPENRALAERLLEHGAWVSELPMHAAVRAENFPSRNRLIAGMSLGVLVVEAAQRSGALITARLAAEYNREVFALPGRVQDPTSFGTNGLIRDGGAKLVMGLEDILAELGEVGAAMRPGGCEPRAAPPQAAQVVPGALTPAERTVLELVGQEAVLQEELLTRAGLGAGEVLAALTSLELKGCVRRLAGGRVARRTGRG